MGKVIHCEMSQKFKFDHTNKWYVHNPAFVQGNDTHKLLWDFDIQMDHLILAWRPDLIIIDKKKTTCKIVDFAVLADNRIKLKECEKKNKYLDLTRELKKLWNRKVTIIPIVIGTFGTVTKGLLKGLEDLEDEWRPSKLQHYWERTEYWEESRRLAVTQTPLKNHQLKLMLKNSQGVNNNNDDNNNNHTRRPGQSNERKTFWEKLNLF